MKRSLSWSGAAAAIALATAVLALARARGGPTRAALDAFEARLAGLEAERARARGPSEGEARLERALAELGERLGRVETGLSESRARRVPVEAQPEPAVVGAVVEAGAPAAEPSQAIDATARREFEELLALFGTDYDFDGTPEQMQRFYELARKGLLDRSIAELEAQVAADPGDLGARMQLADLYVAKIMTLPHGPEQGLWGDRAENQWRAVAERDPEHWGANFSLGHNFAFYPDVMGKTRDAIHYLEEARRIQENGSPEDEQVRVYLALSRLYSRQGDEDRARDVLEAGLRRHPSNAELLGALEDIDG